MLSKFAVIGALCLPTYSLAEVVELTCVGPTLSNTLTFDTEAQSAKYAFWPWSEIMVWNDEVIVWAAFTETEDDNSAGLFMFKRDTSELAISVVWERWDAIDEEMVLQRPTSLAP